MSEPVRTGIPLSLAQERYLQLQLDHPASCMDNLFHVFHVKGALNIDALERSFAHIQRRHEILRTIYSASVAPTQNVVQDARVDFNRHDLPDDQAHDWLSVVREAGRKPFDLLRDPPLRCDVYRIAPDEHAILLNLHHIAYDFHSERILFRELESLYAAFAAGEPVPAADPPLQYQEFCLAQHRQRGSEAWTRHLDWWAEHLGEDPPLLELPADVPNPVRSVIADQVVEATLPLDLVRRMKAAGKQHGLSLFVQMFATFNALLRDITGEREIVVGMPMSYRNSPAAERAIGLYTHSVAIRTSFAEDPPLDELAFRTGRTMMQATKHRDVPVYSVYERMPKRDLRTRPLYRIRFNLVNLFYEPLQLAGVSMQSVPDRIFTNPDLMLMVVHGGKDDVLLRWFFDPGLFTRGRVEGWAARYQELAAALAMCLDARGGNRGPRG